MNLLNMQKVFRVGVCAALIAACVFGAGLFPGQSAAGNVINSASLRGAAALDRLKQDGQYEALRTAMSRARFSVSLAEKTPLGRRAWHAPNPAAGYDAYITEEGVTVAINDDSYVSLSLRGVGYGAALRVVGPGEVSGDKQTINIERNGGVREWYVNGPEGLEQGFTLAEPPGAGHAGEPLRLVLGVSEGWRAAAREDGQQVTLRSGEGQSVEYSKLVVRDHLGRNVPARLAVVKRQVVIEVEDGEAIYPLTIDPLFSFQQKLVASDGGLHDFLGHSVALSGDTVAVGARGEGSSVDANRGAVYVFTRSGASWTFQQKITAGDGANGDYFGWSVGLSGDTLVVGAAYDDIAGNLDQGSAYIFTRTGGVWTEQQKLTIIGGLDYDWFGDSIAISGDTLVVGSPGDDRIHYTNAGSAYVFRRYGATWALEGKLAASDGSSYDIFGGAVAISGDTIVAGASGDNIGTSAAQGSAYVFTRNGLSWIQQQKLVSSTGYTLNHFGNAVAISGDTAVIGAYTTGVTQFSQGVAHVFTRAGGVWSEQQKLIANDAGEYDHFGGAVAISGDTVVVGAYGDTINGNDVQGSLYVFTRTGSTWTQQPKITASDGAWNDFFGVSVAMTSDTIVAGALGDTMGTNYGQGSAYVFALPPCPALTLSPASLPNGAAGTAYQQQVSVSGGGGPYQFAVTGGALPPGLSLTASGWLSGTPTTPGMYQFTIHAAPLIGPCSASRAYTMIITPPCPTILLQPQTLPDGLVDTPYDVTLTAAGGAAPYRFVAQSPLPPGLSLSTHGVLSGTPTEEGNFQFRVLIIDANDCASAATAFVTILKGETDPCSALTLEPSPLPEGMVGKEYKVELMPSGGREPYRFAAQGALPPGLSLTAEGYLLGTPTEEGSFYFRLTITDAGGCSKTFECPMTILKSR
ncbi:MAG TPA: putative Ig domain-containing protein [Blastocatellia bacterium]|nr:putative Ig domain-containing protein [Blastocatellia bacterium]